MTLGNDALETCLDGNTDDKCLINKAKASRMTPCLSTSITQARTWPQKAASEHHGISVLITLRRHHYLCSSTGRQIHRCCSSKSPTAGRSRGGQHQYGRGSALVRVVTCARPGGAIATQWLLPTSSIHGRGSPSGSRSQPHSKGQPHEHCRGQTPHHSGHSGAQRRSPPPSPAFWVSPSHTGTSAAAGLTPLSEAACFKTARANATEDTKQTSVPVS